MNVEIINAKQSHDISQEHNQYNSKYFKHKKGSYESISNSNIEKNSESQYHEIDEDIPVIKNVTDRRVLKTIMSKRRKVAKILRGESK